jgi:hypothetical protein
MSPPNGARRGVWFAVGVIWAAAALLGWWRTDSAYAGTEHWVAHAGSNVALRLGGGGASHATQYRLPSGASQGPDHWYLLRLHAIVRFDGRSRSGRVYLGAGSDGRAGALVDVRLARRSRQGGRCPVRVRWSTIDLVQGNHGATVCGRRANIEMRNYLQYRGVRPGRNRLNVSVSSYDHGIAGEVRVLGDSGVLVTDAGPARLAFGERDAPRAAPAQQIEVPYTLTNEGDREARDVLVTIDQLPRGLKLQGARLQHLGDISDQATGVFRVQARRPGRYRVVLEAVSATSTARTTIWPVVGVRAGGWDLPLLPAGGIVIGGGLTGMWLLRGIKRRRRP